MIEIKDMEKRNFRTFGWVQDSGQIESLYKVVSVFNKDSVIYKELVDSKISELIEIRDGRNRLLDALKANPLKIKYIDLVGKSFKPRPIARCNGIIQATVNGQRRPFIGNWPADNFIRWAQCLGFIKYNYYDDTFEITETGLEFSNSQEGKQRDETRNPNKWWNNFSSNIDEFYFTFISGEFRGNIDEKLNRISIVTNRKGVAITIISLLKLVNEIKAQRMDLNSVKNIFKNKVY